MFKKKEEVETIYDDEYDEVISLEENEIPEIIETIEEKEFEKRIKANKRYRMYKKIINWLFTIIMVILVMITIDVICVARYNVGPFFVINTKNYKDGGSKEYIGFGYKVIAYNQEQGRRDKQIGSWKLQYNAEPLDLRDDELAIEFESNYEETSKKYYKNFIRLASVVKKVNQEKNQLVLEYYDEDNKYTMDYVCSMAKGQEDISMFEKGDNVFILGTVTKFVVNKDNKPNKVYINDCFAENYVIGDNQENNEEENTQEENIEVENYENIEE